MDGPGVPPIQQAQGPQLPPRPPGPMPPSPRPRLRGFWNDPEGVTVPEILELVVALTWAVAVGVELVQLIQGRLASVGVDLLTVISWTVLAVLGGGIVQRFGFPRVRGPQQMPPYGYGGWGWGGYGFGYDPYGYGYGAPTSPSQDSGSSGTDGAGSAPPASAGGGPTI